MKLRDRLAMLMLRYSLDWRTMLDAFLLMERHPDHAAFVITRDGVTYSTPNFCNALRP